MASTAALEPVALRHSASPIGFSFARVSKRYGSIFALRNVSLEINPGEFVALLGPNGSGKSTIIKIAGQASRPTAGTVAYSNAGGGAIEDSTEVRSRIGMVGHASLTYDDLSAEENLHFFARLYSLPGIHDRTEALLAAVGLLPRRASLVRTFSRGMRQRLSIARALLPGPGLLLLDEPTTGLDQQALEWLAACLRDLHRSGCTIVMSTHGASEVLSLATRRILLDSGSVAGGAA